MSIELIRPYFKTRMSALGLKEWRNPFDTSNIPENIIASQYNVVLAPITQFKLNQQNLDLKVQVNLKLFAKAYKEHMVAYDSATALMVDAIMEVMNPVNRLTQAALKNISILSASIDPYAPDNDNVMVVNFQFVVDLAMDVCQ